jgi:hypothetical protein
VVPQKLVVTKWSQTFDRSKYASIWSQYKLVVFIFMRASPPHPPFTTIMGFAPNVPNLNTPQNPQITNKVIMRPNCSAIKCTAIKCLRSFCYHHLSCYGVALPATSILQTGSNRIYFINEKFSFSKSINFELSRM